MQIGRKKQCLRCSEFKEESEENFRSPKQVTTLNPGFIKICIECEKKAENHKQEESTDPKNKIKSRVCPGCGTVFTPKRDDGINCSDKCRKRGYKRIQDEETKQCAIGRMQKKEIPKRFLERGKIYGVHYT